MVLSLACNAAAQPDPNYSLEGFGVTPQPDLFTGTASTSTPIQVPPGRHGIQPALSLEYWSGNGDGWLGPGWKLEVGAIQRQTRFGVSYSGDDYTFRLASVSTDLVSIGSGEYRAKIEGGFSRVKQLTAGDGKPYWEATDKKGTRYLFGQTTASRQADPANAANIFKWCLDQVIDANGNYMTVTYLGDQGQGYLGHIDYTGNGSTQPTNTVKFYLEDRPDAPPMYTTNFRVVTAKRLKTIEVKANGNLVRAYKLSYTTSGSTSRSLLSSVQQYGKDATLDGTGAVTGGTALPAMTAGWQDQGSTSFDARTQWDGGCNAGWVDCRVYVADLNGDGKADVLEHYQGTFSAHISTGSAFGAGTQWGTGCGASWVDCRVYVADLNGDGKADVLEHYQGTFSAHISTGSAFGAGTQWGTGCGADWADCRVYVADLNGDGKADVLEHYQGTFSAHISTGSAFGVGAQWNTGAAPCSAGGIDCRVLPEDLNGDGRTDVLEHSGQAFYAHIVSGMQTDLLTSVSNGLGGTTTIAYAPSTQYTNTLLPFPIQTVSSITTNDGNGNVSTTTYSFSGGFYHIGERDLRGFNYAKVNGPVGPNGEQTINETWFHQGNDLAVDTNNPNVANGYMKGKPYRVRVSDGAGHIYSEVTTSYTADSDGNAPFFTPPLQVDTSICDGGTCGKQTRTVYTFDAYGNVTREDQYGDLSDTTDDRTVVRAFSPNTTAWIVGLPSSETIYKGIGTSNQAAQTSFYYDGVTDCTVGSTNQTPTQGNLTRVVRWLNGGNSPETRMAYDSYGNLTCTRDANGNTTTMTYDSSFTFPKVATNPLGQQKTTQYYGVDGVVMDTGLYGQVKSVTDPNSAVITTTYDVFGRKSQVNFPDGGWTSTSYNAFGTVGSQNIQTNTQAGLSTFTYFDGLGRPITVKKTGPDTKTIAVQTQYNVRGAVLQASLPYFDGIESATGRWKTFVYDPVGRVTQMTNPDASLALSCTGSWVTVTIDHNNHRRRETRDAYGRLARVDEYLSTWSTCDTSAGAPYATTTYQYDVLGNLLSVTDAKGNQSTMQYDTLSRKTSMQDPDMGNWTYAYDAAGNLIQQTDAKSQGIYFRYDALNRRVQKDYGTQKALGSGDVMYAYDGGTSNGKGRLTGVQDQSGSVLFYYDTLGRTTRADKSLDGTTYTTQTGYDTVGRVLSVTFPDNAVLSYAYNGPVLLKASDTTTTYGQYAGYNALGQPGTLTLGNGVVTTYTYANSGNTTCPQQTFRLCTLQTVLGTNPAYQNFQYSYDSGGNIAAITDAVNGNQTFGYDELNRLTSATGPYGTHTYSYNEIGNLTFNPLVGTYTYPTSGTSSVQPHAVTTAGSNSYTYDTNGNMNSGAGRTYTWDFENRPTSITSGGVTTTMVYDGDGGRVKKIAGTTTVRYIGKLYECDTISGVTACVKYIFAGSQRIAIKQVTNGLVDYYHPDHLGSSSVITHGTTGAQEENITYYPYGATQTNTSGTTPPTDMPYKYTDKELDSSTGLYFYGARYYDATLGRFLSADTLVEAPGHPQTLNRYTYVGNNPLRYTDPTGHCFIVCISFKHFNIAKAVFKYATWGFAYPLVDMVLKTSPYVQMVAGAVVAAYAGPLGSAWYSAYVTQLNGGSTGDMLKAAAITEVSAEAFNAIDSTNWNLGAKVIGHGVVGGVSAELQGGRFQEGFMTAGASRLAMGGWEYMRDSVNAGAIESGNQSSCKFGPCTAGSRVTIDGTTEVPSATGFANQGMGPEVVPGRPDLRAPHNWDWIPGAIDVVEAISKAHDFGNSFTYQGGFYAHSINGWANDVFNVYSMSTMLPAAAYTGAAFMRGTPAVDLAVDRAKRR